MTELITLKDQQWFDRQKVAGKAVARCLSNFKSMFDNELENIKLTDIENECLEIIEDLGCTPTFKGYKGFPGSVCLSVNKQLVHGIPSDYLIKEGDIVTLDLGATFEGAIADAALTLIYKEPRNKKHVEMLKLCQDSLYKGIKAVEVGKCLGSIGQAIYRHTRDKGYYLIDNYGGHGIDYDTPHAPPFVANKAKSSEGVKIRKGLSIAIEPMLSMKSARTKVESDGWTVTTKGMNCHFEHSILVWDDGVHIMTEWEKL